MALSNISNYFALMFFSYQGEVTPLSLMALLPFICRVVFALDEEQSMPRPKTAKTTPTPPPHLLGNYLPLSWVESPFGCLILSSKRIDSSLSCSCSWCNKLKKKSMILQSLILFPTKKTLLQAPGLGTMCHPCILLLDKFPLHLACLQGSVAMNTHTTPSTTTTMALWHCWTV